MKFENIVELYDYTENDEEIVLLMEYCNDANYFQEKIEEVSITPSLNDVLRYSNCHVKGTRILKE
ncbi:MAG: hypothetical protein ACMG6E_09905 [Candidatus Roizmanbacteria bacterium]